MADVAEIDGFATFGQKEEAVEFLKQDGGGLMDRGQHGLAVVGEGA